MAVYMKFGKMVAQGGVEIKVDEGCVHIRVPHQGTDSVRSPQAASLTLDHETALILFDLLGDVIRREPHPDEE